jgi:hypothetical protein
MPSAQRNWLRKQITQARRRCAKQTGWLAAAQITAGNISRPRAGAEAMNTKLRKNLMEQRSARAIAATVCRALTFVRPVLEFVIPCVLVAFMFNAVAGASVTIGGTPVHAQGVGCELVSGFVTAPSSTFTNWTMATNNSLTLRNSTFAKKVQLLAAWCQNQVAGTLSIRSPKMHDNVQGIRSRITTTVMPLFPLGYPQNMYPQDTLTVQQTGSAVGGQIESGSMLVYYEDLPGANARFITPDVVAKRGVQLLGQETTITTGAGGGYTGQEAINAQFDNFVANTDYALVGYETNVQCCSVRILGNDTSNMGIGGPGEPTLRDVTCHWFDMLSTEYGLPLIPVFNSANKSSILVDALQSQAAAAVIATWYFVQLAPA